MIKKILVITFGVVLPLMLIIAAFVGYGYVFENNLNLEEGEEYEVLVYPEDDPRDIYDRLVAENVLNNKQSFILVARQKQWNTAKTGRYILKKGMGNNAIVNMFRAGLQTPVQVTINQAESLGDVAGNLGKQLMLDSAEIYTLFTEETFLQENEVDLASVRSLILLNTYEMYWNIGADALRKRIVDEYKSYWNEERLALAKGLNLSPLQVSVLASIVEKETAKTDEMATVAGLYVNRLDQGMRLQSDPTVIYAKKLLHGEDYEISRVLYADLQIESPYNTYRNTGLPPAPITIPSMQALNGVLHAEKHGYVFMCADPDRPGYHSFAVNLAQHNVNKKKYVKWLNDNNIKR